MGNWEIRIFEEARILGEASFTITGSGFGRSDKEVQRKAFTGIMLSMLLLAACGSANGGEPQVSRPADLMEPVDGAGGMVQDENKDSGMSPDTQDKTAGQDNATGQDNTAEQDKAAGQQVETQPEEGTLPPDVAEGTAPSSAPEEGSPSYKEIYAQAVSGVESESFSLIYLDDDGIPELVVWYGESYSVYTVKDNTLFCMADSFTTVALTYFERTGILCAFDRWNGGGDEGGYGSYYYQTSKEETLTDDVLSTLNFTYNAVYDEEGNYTGEGIENYYYMGQEIDEASYREMQSSLGIVEEDEKSCMENALGKAEMLAALSRQSD